MTPAIEEFEARATPEPNTGCWLWTGAATGAGYPVIGIARRSRPAHRMAYEAAVGPIPSGLTIDHLCCITMCVNPQHMEVVTHGENSRRRGARQTHCKRGHAFTSANTYYFVDGEGYRCRHCRRCKADTVAALRKAGANG